MISLTVTIFPLLIFITLIFYNIFTIFVNTKFERWCVYMIENERESVHNNTNNEPIIPIPPINPLDPIPMPVPVIPNPKEDEQIGD